MKDTDIIHIVFCIDNNFVMPCAVLVISILKTNKHIKVAFHIISFCLSEKDKMIL
jgi:lipopolysaccharide biosynthesis glycosyltransferase